MLCQKCEREVALGERGRRPTPPSAKHPDLNAQLCAGCGALLPAEDGTRRMLEKLSQLSRFGLGGESPPLLESYPSRNADD